MDKADQIKSANNFEVVGLIPAAGKASRLSPLPCSKELIPIGFGVMADDSLRPKVVSHYLLDKFNLAGVSKVYFILRNGKWDIPAYYGDGTILDMYFAYLGHVVQQAITAGLRVYGHAFSDNNFIDIGTPNELDEAYKRYRNT